VPELNSGVLPGNVHADDWIMLILAVISAGLLGFVLLDAPPPLVTRGLFYADCALSSVFLVGFVRRWRRHRWNRRFLARNWYELVAVLPAAHPAVLAHHFAATVLLLARLARVAGGARGARV
jgi:hypothetical protein